MVGNGLRWSVSGANPVAERGADTGEWGQTDLIYTGERRGDDVVTAYFDTDGDERRDEGEPSATLPVHWRQAPPPTVTWQEIDGAATDVKISSDGQIVATTRDKVTDLDPLDGSSFRLAFTAGPLAGRVFGGPRAEPFYGDPQDAPVREGDAVTQESTFRVRWDDVDYVRIHQTVRHLDGSLRIRVTYRVENLTSEPLAYRAVTGGEFRVDGYSGGNNFRQEEPARFIGATEPSSGHAAGLQEVRVSRLPSDTAPVTVPPWSSSRVGGQADIVKSFASTAGMEDATEQQGEHGVGAQWSDHAAAGTALEPGLANAARYEALWRLEEPAPTLFLTPQTTTAEARHRHEVTATLRTRDDEAGNGVPLRWRVTGANPVEGVTETTGIGQAVIGWEGERPGLDTLTVYADYDGDGARDADEPERVATVHWRPETAVDPPVIDPVVAADGTRWIVEWRSSGDQRQFLVPAPARAHFPTCADGSPQMNLHLRINVYAGAGHVVPGSMSLRTVANASNDPANPIDTIPPVGDPVGDDYEFVIDCVRQTTLYLCYTLEEHDLGAESFCVLLGGVGLYDPSGTVYDAQVYDVYRSRGLTPAEARARAALRGARVRLQRRYDGRFRPLLSGDPFLSPNVNPETTRADGTFGWSVPPGTYRVEVSRDGYETTTSQEVVVPPAAMGVDVALVRLDGVPPPPEIDPGPDDAPPPAAPSPKPTATPSPSPARTPRPSPARAPAAALATEPSPPARPALVRPRLDRRGRLLLGLRCPATAVHCAGSLKLLTRAHRHRIATLSYRLRAGGTRRYRLRLSHRARAALLASGRRTARIVVRHADARETTVAVRLPVHRE